MNKGIIAFCLLLVFNYLALTLIFDYGEGLDDENYQQQIEQLDRENEALKKANLQLDKEVAVLMEEKDSLSDVIEQSATERETLKIERDEKMDSINGMDNDELYGFFSNFKTDSLNRRFRH